MDAGLIIECSSLLIHEISMPGLESRYNFLWSGPCLERKKWSFVLQLEIFLIKIKKINSKVVADCASKRMIIKKFVSGPEQIFEIETKH